jgi:hypothetical protein
VEDGLAVVGWADVLDGDGFEVLVEDPPQPTDTQPARISTAVNLAGRQTRRRVLTERTPFHVSDRIGSSGLRHLNVRASYCLPGQCAADWIVSRSPAANAPGHRARGSLGDGLPTQNSLKLEA